MTFMKELQNYIYTKWVDITLVVLFMFIGLIIMVLNNISFKTDDDVKTKKLEKVVIIEGMNDNKSINNVKVSDVKVSDVENNLNKTESEETLLNKIEGGFCDKYKGQSHLLEEHCNKLANGVCKVSGCCILAHNSGDNSNKCIAGNVSGPTFHTTEDGTDLNFDYYYYKNKCYGNKCVTPTEKKN